MDRSRWLSEFKRRLRCTGLPNWYIVRSVVEINDHLAEASEGSGELNPCDVIGKTAEQFTQELQSFYRNAKWYRRLPNFLWVLLSMPLCWGICAGFYIFTILLLKLFGGSLGTDGLDLSSFQLQWIFFTGELVTPIIAAFVLFVCFEHVALPKWAWIGCIAMLMLGFVVSQADFTLPELSRDGSLTLTVDYAAGMMLGNRFLNILQVFVILVVAGFEALRNHREYQLFPST